jgi:hypothetical protein
MTKKPVEKTPVIAVRVGAALHQQIKAAAKRSGRSMSEEMAWLLENGFEWQRALGDRDAMLEQARQLLHEASEHALRIPKDALELHLRRQNWRSDGMGRWVPPEVHGLPPDGFNPEVTSENLFSPVAKATPAKKRKTK